MSRQGLEYVQSEPVVARARKIAELVRKWAPVYSLDVDVDVKGIASEGTRDEMWCSPSIVVVPHGQHYGEHYVEFSLCALTDVSGRWELLHHHPWREDFEEIRIIGASALHLAGELVGELVKWNIVQSENAAIDKNAERRADEATEALDRILGR